MKILSIFVPCFVVVTVAIITSALQRTAQVKSYSRHRVSPEIQARMDRARQLLMQGQQARVAGDLKTAETDLKECLQFNTVSNQFAREDLTKVYEAEGRSGEALQTYHDMLHPPDGSTPGTWGTDAFTLIHYAAALNKAGRWPEAVQTYEGILKNPNMPDNLEQPADAEPRLDIHFDPNVAQPKEMQAMLHVVEGWYYGHNYKEALPQFEQAMAIDPNLAVAHFYRGYALRGQSRLAEAKKEFATAAESGQGQVQEAAKSQLRAIQ